MSATDSESFIYAAVLEPELILKQVDDRLDLATYAGFPERERLYPH